MTLKQGNELKNRIMDEMTVDYSNALEKNFDLAKNFIRITKDGKISVLFKKNLTGKERILLYLIGKIYAKEAGLSASIDVSNQELLNELGIPSGSLLPWLKDLRGTNKIRQIKKEKYMYHNISLNAVESVLIDTEKKIKKAGLIGS